MEKTSFFLVLSNNDEIIYQLKYLPIDKFNYALFFLFLPLQSSDVNLCQAEQACTGSLGMMMTLTESLIRPERRGEVRNRDLR